jgi:hypothetical protein
VSTRFEALGAVVAEEQRAVEELRMGLEGLCLRDELEPGAGHRLVELPRDTGASCDAADAVGEPAERVFVRIPPRQAPRHEKVSFMRDLQQRQAFDVVLARLREIL